VKNRFRDDAKLPEQGGNSYWILHVTFLLLHPVGLRKLLLFRSKKITYWGYFFGLRNTNNDLGKM
jgi:hypothetical protein